MICLIWQIACSSTSLDMALVQCVECNATISDKAKACPKCGSTEPFKKKEEFGNCGVCLAKIPLNSLSCPNCGDPQPFQIDVMEKQYNSQQIPQKEKENLNENQRVTSVLSQKKKWLSTPLKVFSMIVFIIGILVGAFSGLTAMLTGHPAVILQSILQILCSLVIVRIIFKYRFTKTDTTIGSIIAFCSSLYALMLIYDGFRPRYYHSSDSIVGVMGIILLITGITAIILLYKGKRI